MRILPAGARGAGSAGAGGEASQSSASSTNGVTARMPPGDGVARTRRAGRWAAPRGTSTVKVVPSPSSLLTWMEPPWSFTSSLTSASPIPIPSRVRAGASGTR